MENLEYEQRVVAFIDIMGFSSMIRDSEQDLSKIELIYETLAFLKNREDAKAWNLELIAIEEDAQKKGVQTFDISGKTNCSCFSDSIIVSVKIGDNDINRMVSTLICNLSFIGAKLLSSGILIRGGITIGKLIHHDNGIVMGQGLIDAYLLESKIAVMPRIILSDNLLSQLNYPLDSKRNRYPYHQYLTRFDDGCVGFHQMIYFQVTEPSVDKHPDTLKKELKTIKQQIITGLDISFQHPDIFKKYKWLMEAYNELLIFVEDVKENIPDIYANSTGHNIHYTVTGRSLYPPKNKNG